MYYLEEESSFHDDMYVEDDNALNIVDVCFGDGDASTSLICV